MCRGLGVPSNDALFERSTAAIPGGVSSSIRAFKAVGGRPYVVARAEGPYVYDVEGRRYIDLVQSYGAVILGHAHPAVTAALAAAARDGTSYGAPTPREMKLAETIGARVASCEQVRLMNSGTEATSTAVRLARGFTERDRIVIFHGNFHGATDALLAAGGSGVATLGLPGTAGVPAGAVAETLVVPYNVVPELDERVAAVIVEPVAANMGVVAPAARVPRRPARRMRSRRGAARVRRGDHRVPHRCRRRPEQVRRHARPDDVRQGHRRRPADRRCRRADETIMETLSPLGPVFHAGTLAGNPLATAAGLAALGELGPDEYVELAARARHLAALLRDACAAAGFPAQFPVVGSLVGIVCGDVPPPVDFESARRTDVGAYAAFFHAMLDAGVAMAPGAYEAIFVGMAHTDDVVEAIGEAAAGAAVTAARSLG